MALVWVEAECSAEVKYVQTSQPIPAPGRCIAFVATRVAFLSLIVSIFGLFYVFVPFAEPSAGVKANWNYLFLSPPLLSFVSSVVQVMLGLHVMANPGRTDTVFLPPWVFLAEIFVGTTLGFITVTLPVAFLGYYPCNWLAGFVLRNVLVNTITRFLGPRFLPGENHDDYVHNCRTAYKAGNTYLLCLLARMAFLAGFYRTSGVAQLALVIGLNLLLQIDKRLRRRTHGLRKLPLRIHMTMCLPAAFQQDVVLCFAHPAAHSVTTLVLMLLGRVTRLPSCLHAFGHNTGYDHRCYV
eukprot:TRINITY_DN4031_c0_g2_i2.p1 TRINITY_DN4031_c0_g2~~TRINITY_DN4031_c0_g2_i2.p1  ORF type:complete len:296 (-),score=18.80 TRINITY_DN4031_c0_g2_i2:498-1385(-)